MPEHRVVTLFLIATFLLVVVIDFWRKSRLLARPASPPEAPGAEPPPGA